MKKRIFKMYPDCFVAVIEDDFGIAYYNEFETQKEAEDAANDFLASGEGESLLNEKDAIAVVEDFEMIDWIIEL